MSSSKSIATRVFLLAALPFLLGAVYSSCRTLWFKVAAAEAFGTVVDITGPPPALVVEYSTTGEETLRTESAGSDLYGEVALGDPITVLYDPDDPSDARLDLFVENWVVPLFLGIPAGLILLALLLIRRDLQPDLARMGGRVVAYPFSVIGLGLLVFAGYLFNADRRLAAGGETALGTVVDFRETSSQRSRSSRDNPESFVHYREPVITFTAQDGQSVRFVALSGSYPEGLNKGDQLEVVYLPANPKTAEIKGSQRLLFGAQMVTILGAVSLGAGLMILVPKLWQRRGKAAPPNRRRQSPT